MEEEDPDSDLPRRKLRLAGLRIHGLVPSSPGSCCVAIEFLAFRSRVGGSSLKIALESLLPGDGPAPRPQGGTRCARLVLLDPPPTCPSPSPSPCSDVFTAAGAVGRPSARDIHERDHDLGCL